VRAIRERAKREEYMQDHAGEIKEKLDQTAYKLVEKYD